MIGATNRKNSLTFGGALAQTQIPGHFSIFLTVAEKGILGHLLAFLTQSPPHFYETRRNDWCRQGDKSTTFWERSSRHPDPD